MNSSRFFGRNAASASSLVRSGVVMRAGSVAIAPLIRRWIGLRQAKTLAGGRETMLIDRRTLMLGGAAVMAAGPAMAQRKRAAPPDWYDQAIVIDALGGIGDPYGEDDVTRMSDRGWQETMAT